MRTPRAEITRLPLLGLLLSANIWAANDKCKDLIPEAQNLHPALPAAESAAPEAIIPIQIRKPLADSDGWDNLGIFEATINGDPQQNIVVAKVPSYQSDFDHISAMTKQVSDLGIGANYKGVSSANFKAGTRKILLTEKIAGYSSKDLRSLQYINEKTFEQIQNHFNLLLKKEILPLDFQFMVKPDGSIAVIDCDLYETVDSVKNLRSLGSERDHGTARYQLKRFLDKVSIPSYADMIWGENVYPRLPEKFKRQMAELLDTFRTQTKPLLNP